MGTLFHLGRHISVAYRQSNRYYDRVLAPYQIGCGQQFFLVRVYENQGISMLDLARMGWFDKGTVTRAVQKLEELEYLRSEADGRDRRVRRLYTTPGAEAVVQAVYAARVGWERILTTGLTPEEARAAGALMRRMAQNAFDYSEQEEQEHGTGTESGTAGESPGI